MKTPQNKPSRPGLAHVLDATRYSVRGISQAIRQETAFRQELALLLILVPAAFWLGQSPLEYALLLGSLLLVLVVELINSALEALADRITTAHDPLIGQAKDMGSAAVFLSMMIVLLCWGAMAWTRLA
ncbi:MAG TPA: diacylglycerol kinase [Pseudomonadales bacterium]|jgi:diacylglycerol kinase (ATP)